MGDVVKRSPQDALSGTVTHTSMLATLYRPRPWPPATMQVIHEDNEPCFGNYVFEEEGDILINIPSEELIPANAYITGNFVVYRDWVGRITDTWDEVYIRLSNNSIVVPEDIDELEITSIGDAYGDEPAVGDYVQTKKSLSLIHI